MGMPPKHTIKENKELMSEWNYEKNNALGLFPDRIGISSKYKVWWNCPNGHQYQMAIVQRSSRNNKCPLCSGHKTVAGINDLQTMYPGIAAEWNYERNGDLKPNQLSCKNGRKVWWKCQYGHEWQATPHDRVGDKTGCPECNKRRLTSYAEQAIYYYVRQLYPDTINRYKDMFDNQMELDVFIPSIKLGIEYDGANWHKTEEQHRNEAIKYDYCHQNDITLIRVKEDNKCRWRDVADWVYYVEKDHHKHAKLQETIQAILDSIDPESNAWLRKNPFKIHSRIVADLDRDANAIREYLTPIPNSLKELRPELVKDWDYDKNGNLIPEMFGINSNDYAYWKCHKCGHEWRTTIIHRAGKRHSGCPECSKIKRGKTFTKGVVSVVGSLSEINPLLASEWNYEKNGDLTPNDITEGRFKPVWWKCNTCGYEWSASPNNRKRGIGCPHCSGRVAMAGVDDLQTVNPELASEWNYEKNTDKTPSMFRLASGKKVWWKCKHCGYEWEAIIANRSKGHGCPKCSRKSRRRIEKNNI